MAAFEYAKTDAPYVWATSKEVAAEMWKMTTKTDGLSILIRVLNIIVGK